MMNYGILDVLVRLYKLLCDKFRRLSLREVVFVVLVVVIIQVVEIVCLLH